MAAIHGRHRYSESSEIKCEIIARPIGLDPTKKARDPAKSERAV